MQDKRLSSRFSARLSTRIDMGDLKVYVMEASNLIPADRNGKSDPFVSLEILEDPIQGKQKTKIQSKVTNANRFLSKYPIIFHT